MSIVGMDNGARQFSCCFVRAFLKSSFSQRAVLEFGQMPF